MAEIDKYAPTTARRTRLISLRGIDYHINEWGDEDAPLFVYLHGWADTGSTFQFVVDALKSDWHVVAPDWRGFGNTAYRTESSWFPDYLADLNALLEVYSPGVPVRLVGHSMGANVASLYAGTMPERVTSIVNIEGFGLHDSDPNDAPQRYREWLESGRASPEFSTYPDFESLAMRIRKRSPGLSNAEADFVAREWAREDSGVVRLRADPRHKLPNPVLYRRAEAEACWRKVIAQVLLVSGDRSPFADRFGSTSELPFPHQRSTTVSDAGHMIHFEAPQRLAEQIEQFLKQPL